VTAILAISYGARAADFAPALQWVKTTGGSGSTSVAAATADSHGNLYVVGATSSLDFPTVQAAQPVSGGTTLVRINLANASASRLVPANLPPVSAAAVAPSNPAILYTASANQIWKSTDAGSTWSMVSQFSASVTVSALAVDPATPANVLAGTTTLGLFQSTDGGLTWVAANVGIPLQPNGVINVGGIWIEPAAPGVIFASTNSGLLRSTDAGQTWTAIAGGNPSSFVSFDPLTKGTIYFVNADLVSRSTDDGSAFVSLTSLPNRVPVYALMADPHHAGVLYAGSSAGVYQSTDGGITWSLKLAGVTTVLAADPNSSALYADVSTSGLVRSLDGFATSASVGPTQPSVRWLLVSGSNLFEISAPSTDAFAIKLDTNGNVIYSTYFGGSGSDRAVALAVGADGSLYVAGATASTDLPVTAGAYLTTAPAPGKPLGFVLKLTPNGSVDWATYFPDGVLASIAVDSAGNPYVGGASAGGLPTTPGAYQTAFQQSVTSNGFFGVIGPLSAFVTKLNSKGTALVYSTYIPTDNQRNIVSGATALAVDAAGNAWVGVPLNGSLFPGTGVSPSVVELNASGSALLGSAVQKGLGGVTALTLDTDSNVYIAGSIPTQGISFPATSGAFQAAPQPAQPVLQNQNLSGGGLDAFVAKWDRSLTHLLAATLLGGELPDTATSIAVDAAGTVIVGGYTDSQALPTHAPFQTSFSTRAGFVAGFDSNLSNLLFSTYLGDGRPFAAQAAIPDGNGNILLAGNTLSPGGAFLGGDNGASFTVGNLAVFNKIALAPAPAVRLDTVQNYASHIAAPLAPGEPVIAWGAGFGDDAQLVLDGSPLTTTSPTATSLVAVVSDTAIASGPHTLQVSSHGTLSNPVYMPGAKSSPAVYSTDGSGVGQGYILNSNGTLNSPANPAATGSAITIFANGAGPYTVSDGYAITDLSPSVFIDGFYCNGIAAKIAPVDGIPGNVYQLSVYVPDLAVLVKNNPDLKNFTFPPMSSLRLVMGPTNPSNAANSLMLSQSGIFINIK